MATNPFLRGAGMLPPQPTMTNQGGIANPYGGGNVGAGMSAEAALAAFTRQQWQDYVSQFIPIENELIDYAMDESLPGKNMARAVESVQKGFAAQPAITERRMRGLGIQLNPDEQASAKRDTALQKGLSEVQAANTARDLTVDRQRSLMGGPAMPQRDPMGGVR